jgi:hypothetical protein
MMMLVRKAFTALLLVALLTSCASEEKKETSEEEKATVTTVEQEEKTFESFLDLFPKAGPPDTLVGVFTNIIIPDTLVHEFILEEVPPGYYQFSAVAELHYNRDFYTLIYGVDGEEAYHHYLATYTKDGNPIKAIEIGAMQAGTGSLAFDILEGGQLDVSVCDEDMKRISTTRFQVSENGQIKDLSAELKAKSENEFLTMFDQFINIYEQFDTTALKQYIHPNWGYFILDNPGVYLTAGHTTAVEHLRFDPEDDVYRPLPIKKEKEELPRFSCDKDDWDKKGCFWDDHLNENRILSILKALEEFDLLIEGDEYFEIAQKIDAKIQYKVYNTKAFRGFYFGKIDDKWYLLCLDRIAPCSA